MHLIGWLSLHLLDIFFLELWSVLSFGPYFFVLAQLLCSKGQRLRCSPWLGNAGHCSVTLYMGEGPIGSNGACSTLCWFSVTSPTTYNQIGSFWCWFQGGWVCVCSRSLWVSPTNSPVWLGVSPAVTSTPTGVFSRRFKALFPLAGALGCGSVSSPVVPPGLSACECGTTRSASHHLATSPLRPPAHLCPSYRLDECFFL